MEERPMAMFTGNSQHLHADPNVTPLIDVLLVLLIIFMVIVPVTPRGLSAMLPQPATQTQSAPSTPIVVEILAGPDGPLYQINGHSVPGRAGLVDELNRIYSVRAEKVLFLKGDPALSFAFVADVIDVGHAIGIDQVALLTPGLTAQ
jgi:biopolymer transport protein TolR